MICSTLIDRRTLINPIKLKNMAFQTKTRYFVKYMYGLSKCCNMQTTQNKIIMLILLILLID